MIVDTVLCCRSSGICQFNPTRSPWTVQSSHLRSSGQSSNSCYEWRRTVRFLVGDHQWRCCRWDNRWGIDTYTDRGRKFWLWANLGSILSYRHYENSRGWLSICCGRTEWLLCYFKSSRIIFHSKRSFTRRLSFLLVHRGKKTSVKSKKMNRLSWLKKYVLMMRLNEYRGKSSSR